MDTGFLLLSRVKIGLRQLNEINKLWGQIKAPDTVIPDFLEAPDAPRHNIAVQEQLHAYTAMLRVDADHLQTVLNHVRQGDKDSVAKAADVLLEIPASRLRDQPSKGRKSSVRAAVDKLVHANKGAKDVEANAVKGGDDKAKKSPEQRMLDHMNTIKGTQRERTPLELAVAARKLSLPLYRQLGKPCDPRMMRG